MEEYYGYKIEYNTAWVTTIDGAEVRANTKEELCKIIDKHIKGEEEIKKMEQKRAEQKIKMEKENDEFKAMQEIPKFSIELHEIDLLKKPITAMNELITEASFVVDENMMHLNSLDPANVAMVDFSLLSSGCTEYRLNKKFIFGFNVTMLKDILSKAKVTDVLRIISMESEDKVDQKKIAIEIIGKSKRIYELPIMEVEKQPSKIPDLKFKATIDYDSKQFSEDIAEAGNVADSVQYVADTTFVIKTEGDLHKMKIETDARVLSQGAICKYTIEYLKHICKAKTISDEVEIKFSTDYPSTYTYLVVDKIKLVYVLAPRIAND